MNQKPNFAVAVFDLRANDYQEKFMDVSLYAHSFDLFCTYLNNQARVLELACGPGNITRYLLDQRPDLRIMGTDLSPKMIELARVNNPTAIFQLMDVKELHTLQDAYNGVMVGFCLPYLNINEVRKLIHDSTRVLVPGGIIYISTMEENEDHQSGIKTSGYGDQLYMYYHKSADLTEALEQNGFNLLHLSRILTKAENGTTTVDLLLIAQKNQ
jgi:trans-aconitate methyltransferase